MTADDDLRVVFRVEMSDFLVMNLTQLRAVFSRETNRNLLHKT